MKTPKTDYLPKKSISLDSRFVDLENTGWNTTFNSRRASIQASYYLEKLTCSGGRINLASRWYLAQKRWFELTARERLMLSCGVSASLTSTYELRKSCYQQFLCVFQLPTPLLQIELVDNLLSLPLGPAVVLLPYTRP